MNNPSIHGPNDRPKVSTDQVMRTARQANQTSSPKVVIPPQQPATGKGLPQQLRQILGKR
jgi:hypothetical protein